MASFGLPIYLSHVLWQWTQLLSHVQRFGHFFVRAGVGNCTPLPPPARHHFNSRWHSPDPILGASNLPRSGPYPIPHVCIRCSPKHSPGNCRRGLMGVGRNLRFRTHHQHERGLSPSQSVLCALPCRFSHWLQEPCGIPRGFTASVPRSRCPPSPPHAHPLFPKLCRPWALLRPPPIWISRGFKRR